MFTTQDYNVEVTIDFDLQTITEDQALYLAGSLPSDWLPALLKGDLDGTVISLCIPEADWHAAVVAGMNAVRPLLSESGPIPAEITSIEAMPNEEYSRRSYLYPPLESRR
ncbi:hypothetical protein [Rhodococcus sp. NPDC049939]|uniref:hypothetical protein n=1 Tax=Rhodococcus sp. NPDC049939 TaxID=3155511 RepID=UPI003408F7AE